MQEWAAAALFLADLVPDDAREALNAGVEDSNGVVLGVSVVAGITPPANRVVGLAVHGHSLTVHLARPPGEHHGPDHDTCLVAARDVHAVQSVTHSVHVVLH